MEPPRESDRTRATSIWEYIERAGCRRPSDAMNGASLAAVDRTEILVVRVPVIRRVVRVPRKAQLLTRVVVGRSDIDAHVGLSAAAPDEEVITNLWSATLEVQPKVVPFTFAVLDHPIAQEPHVRLPAFETDASGEIRRIPGLDAIRDIRDIGAVACTGVPGPATIIAAGRRRWRFNDGRFRRLEDVRRRPVAQVRPVGRVPRANAPVVRLGVEKRVVLGDVRLGPAFLLREHGGDR